PVGENGRRDSARSKERAHYNPLRDSHALARQFARERMRHGVRCRTEEIAGMIGEVGYAGHGPLHKLTRKLHQEVSKSTVSAGSSLSPRLGRLRIGRFWHAGGYI